MHDHDTNKISDLSFCNQVRLKTSHSFRFEDSYDSLCHKFHLHDIEEQNLRLKIEQFKPPVEDYTDNTKPLIETHCPISCPENEPTDATSVLSTTISNKECQSETEESLEDSLEETEETYTAEKDSSNSRTEETITLSSSHTETMSRPFKDDPFDKNLHFQVELITELSNPTE